jgi:RNA polymerase sigma-70 factor (ECF subfamily)
MENVEPGVTACAVATNNSVGALDAVEALLASQMRASLAGDEVAYRSLLRALVDRLRAYFRRRLDRSPDEAEDLVQEVLLAIHNQRHTYDPERPVTAWVYAIARYKLVDHLRRRARRDDLHLPLDDMAVLFADASEEAAASRHDLLRLLDTLPDRHRIPIVHVKLEGRSVSETARLTGMSESAVKVGVHRGLKALAAIIRKHT